MSNVIKARSLLNYTEDQIWALDAQYQPTDIINVEFDDGLVYPATNSGLIVSWYIWELHRLYPETPLLVNHYTGYKRFKNGSVTSLMTEIAQVLVPTYWDRIDFGVMGKQMYEIVNNVYNMSIRHMEAYVETLDATDVIGMLYHPDIVRLREEAIADGTIKGIQRLYEEIPKVVADPKKFEGNGMAELLATGGGNMGQMLQSVGARGIVTDVNSAVFPNIIFDCFAGGLTNIADFIVESRSAAKALYFQKDPIRTTEYFNRRLQLLNQTLRWLVPGDCGTTDTLDWKMQPGDQKPLDGKYYYDENNQLKYIDAKDRKTFGHLIGKTIRLRSPTMCDHVHKGGICQTCLGRLGATLPVGTNIGHVAAYIMGEKITQAVLSVKHLDTSTEIREITLDKHDLKYIRLSTSRNELIKFNPSIAEKKNLKILLNVEDVGNLTQAMATDDLSELSIYKISTLYKVGISFEDDDIEVVDWVTVSGPSRPSSLTVKFLEYIRDVGYTQEDAKFIEVPLDRWDFDSAAFQLPQKQINMLDFMKQISNMLECGPKEDVKKGLDPSKPEDVVTYLRAVLEYSSQFINVPLSYLEVTTTATMVRNLAEEDYRLPENKFKREFASANALLQNRTVGTALAYQEQANMIYSSHSYDKHHRVPHPMDSLFHPDPNAEIFNRWRYGEEK